MYCLTVVHISVCLFPGVCLRSLRPPHDATHEAVESWRQTKYRKHCMTNKHTRTLAPATHRGTPYIKKMCGITLKRDWLFFMHTRNLCWYICGIKTIYDSGFPPVVGGIFSPLVCEGVSPLSLQLRGETTSQTHGEKISPTTGGKPSWFIVIGLHLPLDIQTRDVT